MAFPLVAIIGRPNVGKSTIFNRILKDRLAITDDQPGVTRDRIYGLADWSGKEFYLIDTGGFIPDSEDLIETMVREQAEVAIEEADLILFIVDAKVGSTDLDREIAVRLLRQNHPVLLVANKADNPQMINETYEFMNLGLGEPMAISSTNGLNFGDFLDKVIGLLPMKEPEEITDALKIAILGRPNVGKSSMVNFLAGKKRQIVTDIPGTTRDAVDLKVKHEDKEYILIDTAGLRRKSKIKENLEFFMSLRTVKALERCDVAALLIEGHMGLVSQDIKIIREIAGFHKPMVICVNKWDLVEKETLTSERFKTAYKDKLPTLDYIPLVFMSAISGKKVKGMFKILDMVYQENNKRVQTSVLNDFLRKIEALKHPPAVQGKHIRLLFITQVAIAPPTFVVFSNYPKLLREDYRRYLENRLRENFGFAGVSIKINYKQR
jgi:GTP-binding protein